MAVKKWRGKWVVDLIVDGKRVRRVSPVQTRRGARAYEDELRLVATAQASTGTVLAPVEAPTFAEFAPDWLTTYAVVNNKPSEQYRKQSNLRHLVPFFGKWRLDEITPRRVEAYKAEKLRKGLANSTINRHLTVLQTVLRSAQEWGRVESVPRIRMLPETHDDFDWLRPEEAARMLDAARGMERPWYTVFFLALRTGMRRGEIFGLHWSEVDFGARLITVKHSLWCSKLGSPKSGKLRLIPMTADLVTTLEAWRPYSPGAVVFPGVDGKVLHSQGIANRMLETALTRAELRRLRFHDLRHTFASHLVLKGRSLKEVQVLMGHHSVTETERYAHIGDDQLATAIDALDGLGSPEGDEGEGEQ